MDQAPRSAFLSTVVLPEERTAVMGVVNIIKTLSQSGGPSVTGVLAGRDHFWVAFVAAGSLKATYDVLLLVFFGRRVATETGKPAIPGHGNDGGRQREGGAADENIDRDVGGSESDAEGDSQPKMASGASGSHVQGEVANTGQSPVPDAAEADPKGRPN
jgi:hypothetical protein